MHIYFVFCLIHCLCSFPCLFTSPQTCSLPSPSPPFYMFISASTQHLHSCSEDKVLGDKGVKRSEHAWKAERVKWNWGDGQGRDEGLGGAVWWKANGWRETKYNTYMNNSSGLLFYLFSNFFQNLFEFQLKLSCPAPCSICCQRTEQNCLLVSL